MVEPWVKKLTEDVMGGAPVEIGKRYLHPEDGPIEIVAGRYWGDFGISNHWTWTVLATSERHSGYAREEWPEIK